MSENIIELPKNLTIHHIEEQFGNLKIAFQGEADTFKIVGTNVESIDTSGLQALLTLIKSAQTNDKKIFWESPTDAIKQGAMKLGLTDKLFLNAQHS